MKKKFWEYILENFTIDNNGRKIIYNIIDWVWMQSMDKEDSVNTLDFLLDGIGIKKEDLKHIFERLYKCDKGRSEKGSGLGLSIAHQLVEKMNGTITANSTQGTGTEFTLLFPLAN